MNPSPFGGPSHISPYVPREQEEPTGGPNSAFDGDLQAATSSTVVGARGQREYKCKLCNVAFYSPQAYGGHMSSHSKARRNNLRGWSSNAARHLTITSRETIASTGTRKEDNNTTSVWSGENWLWFSFLGTEDELNAVT